MIEHEYTAIAVATLAECGENPTMHEARIEHDGKIVAYASSDPLQSLWLLYKALLGRNADVHVRSENNGKVWLEVHERRTLGAQADDK